MIYIIIGVIIAFISILYCVKVSKNVKKINHNVELELQKLKSQENEILNNIEAYKIQYNDLCKDLDITQKLIDENTNNNNRLKKEESDIIEKINQLNETAKNVYKDAETAAKASYNNYCEDLNRQKVAAKEGYDNYEELLKEAYANKQKQLLAESEKVQIELNKIKASRDALVEAQIREKEIKEKTAFYSLQISEADQADILKLEQLKKTFSKPRIISMLVWQTYFQKLLKSKTAEILGTTKTVTGIYKITNLITNECYIGQARNIADRWTEHAKCGLGIDTPAANKLYKAMQEYGLFNFTWELLEEVPAEQLNEKEKYYIELFNSYNYGYNSNKGITK